MGTLIQSGPITEIYVDGVERVEILGDMARVIYFHYEAGEDGNQQRVQAEIVIRCPVSMFRVEPQRWADVVRIDAPSAEVGAAVH